MGDDDPSVGKGRRTFWFAVLSVALLGVVILGLRIRASYSASHATLPDGSTVELLGTSVGLTPFKQESKWARVSRHLPARFQKWFPQTVSSRVCGTTNGLTVYLRLLPTAPIGGYPWSAIETVDEAGFRYSPNGGIQLR